MTAAGGGRFADLAPRVASAIVLAAAGAGALWLGGPVFVALVGLAAGLIGWEVFRMLGAGRVALPAWAGGGLTAAAVLGAILLPGALADALLLLPAAAAVALAGRNSLWAGLYLLVVAVGWHALALLRLDLGLAWALWLVLVVIASDVAGYFAGRLIGGPKFWPRVSPKKTWSGTVAGWLAALALGAAFLAPLGAGWGLLALSVVVAMAGQAGDIAESALKRRVGVKDSSQLIPGHGGVMDRFDALLGAAIAFRLCLLLGLVPGTGG